MENSEEEEKTKERKTSAFLFGFFLIIIIIWRRRRKCGGCEATALFLLRINADTNKPLCISITIILGWTSDQYSSVCPSIRTSEKCLGLSGCLCGQNICVLHYGQFLMICCLASPKTMLTPVVSGRSSEEICVCLSVCVFFTPISENLCCCLNNLLCISSAMHLIGKLCLFLICSLDVFALACRFSDVLLYLHISMLVD